MTVLQLYRLRIGLNGRLEGGQTLMITARIVVATAIMAAVAWADLDRARHAARARSLLAEIVVGRASRCAVACVALRQGWCWSMRIPEARQIEQLIVGRLRGR